MRESYTQYPQKVNVWTGIICDTLIGPFFIEENVNGPVNLDLLENSNIPVLARLFSNTSKYFHHILMQKFHFSELLNNNNIQSTIFRCKKMVLHLTIRVW